MIQTNGEIKPQGTIPSKLVAALSDLVRICIALIVAFIATVITVKLAKGDVHAALLALWTGAFGSSYNFGYTLVETIPIALTGLGVMVAFRSQMFNIGGEGQYLVGALLASFVAINFHATNHLPAILLIPILLTSGAFAGALWAGIAAVLKVWRGVPEVISTIMLNYVATELMSYLVNGPMQRADHSQPATDFMPDSATLPVIWHGTPLHAGLIVAAVAAALVWLMLGRTVAGLAIDAVGANPVAARVAGYSVPRTLINAMLWSGALCGLAGATMLSGYLGFIPEGYTPGYGFTAIAVALLGRLNVLGVLLSSLLFGALTAGAGNMERSAGIGHELGQVIQAVILIVLLISQWDGWRKLVQRRG